MKIRRLGGFCLPVFFEEYAHQCNSRERSWRRFKKKAEAYAICIQSIGISVECSACFIVNLCESITNTRYRARAQTLRGDSSFKSPGQVMPPAIQLVRVSSKSRQVSDDVKVFRELLD